jgi:DUF1016 N-terminal domain
MKKSNRLPPLYDQIRQILESARAGISRTVNTTQVVANWLIGREIVEEEQHGENRAGYGERLVAELSRKITADFGQGYSITNLEHFRDFYRTYPQLLSQLIPHAVRGECEAAKVPHALRALSSGAIPKALRRTSKPSHALRSPSENPAEIANAVCSELAIDHARRGELEIRHTLRGESWRPGQLHPHLAWTHYRTLLRVEKPEARSFYGGRRRGQSRITEYRPSQYASLRTEGPFLAEGLSHRCSRDRPCQRPRR